MTNDEKQKKIYPMYLPRLSKEEIALIVSRQDALARFVFRFGNTMLVLFGVVAVAFLVSIQSVLNSGLYFSLKALCVPLALIVFGYTWAERDFLYTVKGIVGTWVIAGVVYPMLLLWGWPYVMALNAATGTGEKIVYSGRVTAKWESNGLPQAEIRDAATKKPVVLSLSKPQYDAVQPGSPLSVEFQRGGFGFPYRWRYGRGSD